VTDRRQRILDAAMAVFAERGFAAASTSEIAKRAEVAEGTIFRHYRTKKDLLVATVRPLFETIILPRAQHRVQTVLEHDHATLEEFVTEIFDERMAFIQESPALVRVIIQELLLHDEIRTVAQGVFLARFRPFLEAKMVRLREKGLMRDVPLSTAYRLFGSVIGVHGLMRWIILPDAPWDDPVERRESIGFIVRGLAPDGAR
jgi:AcrR family transcriptional regulator